MRFHFNIFKIGNLYFKIVMVFTFFIKNWLVVNKSFIQNQFVFSFLAQNQI
jgi:hypothetical protein